MYGDRDVVREQRQADRRVQPPEVLGDLLAVGAGVERRRRDQGVRAQLGGGAGVLDDPGGGGVDDTGEHRHPAAGRVDHGRQGRGALRVGEVRDLAGGAECEQPVHTAADEVLDEPGEGRGVDLPRESSGVQTGGTTPCSGEVRDMARAPTRSMLRSVVRDSRTDRDMRRKMSYVWLTLNRCSCDRSRGNRTPGGSPLRADEGAGGAGGGAGRHRHGRYPRGGPRRAARPRRDDGRRGPRDRRGGRGGRRRTRGTRHAHPPATASAPASNRHRSGSRAADASRRRRGRQGEGLTVPAPPRDRARHSRWTLPYR